MIPDKLQPGDEVRVIAPARSASDIDERVLDRAKVALESLGLKVTFSKNAFSRNQRGCPTDDEKVEDLHAAFMDENVKCILAAIGGFNSNQLLGKIDWQIIKDNPKLFGGFSDITVLNHAILAKTGLVTYAMPNFYCFGLLPEANYSLEYFRRCLFADNPAEFIVQQSEIFYDFPWNYDEASPRQALENNGPRVVQSGSAEGVMIGGNLCSLNLLNGTEYFPKIEDDSYDSIPETLERHVQALMQQSFFRQIKAILVGRFQGESRAIDDMISDIILSKNIDSKIPVVVNLDFGHTDPKFTYPVGGKCKVVAGDGTRIVIHCDD
ncbi:S66 family peptidase [Candidatus Nanosynbacter lyticus]|uniref:S66 family peptidase n=1 Tax=Candidatus Nanosynbacter lyticus TaxID=2093824 RepID=UPI002553BFED|nr:S66 peptidase family protein [Candidatus Nanosynbacter lyticus]WLD47216.1 LD-carboxypeptidase [Candidatus Nanosynbacter lyticus]